MFNNLKRKLCGSTITKLPDCVCYHGVKPPPKNPDRGSFVASDSVEQDNIPSFLKEQIKKDKSKPFSEYSSEDTVFTAIVKSFDRKREGPPKRLSWNADTFSFENIGRVINQKVHDYEIFQQRFIPERHQQLGNDIAAAHFIVYRGGGVKFYGTNQWIRCNNKNLDDYDSNLPKGFAPNLYLEAIDLSNMNVNLHYEGLNNLKMLSRLRWVSFKNCKNFDDWFLDKITGEFYKTLEYLDISDCPKVSHRGLSALCKLDKLSVLVVNNIADSHEFRLSCLMLEDVFPDLKIEGVKHIEVDFNTDKEDDFQKHVKVANPNV